MNIAVFGATGNIGSRVVAEALSRGHNVTGVARDVKRLNELPSEVSAQIGDANRLEDVIRLVADQDLVVNAMRPNSDKYSEAEKTMSNILVGLAQSNTRLIVAGGAASLDVPGKDGKKVIDDRTYLPSTAKDVAKASMDQYIACLANQNVDWTYLSPPAKLVNGERTGKYRLGNNELLIDDEGNSMISIEDLAMAIINESENPEHHRERFTVGY